jgi:hypothetical protein
MFTTLVVTIAIVAPIAAARLAEGRRNLEWLFWVMITVSAASHVKTWQIIASQQTVSYLVFIGGLLFAAYEVAVIPVLPAFFSTSKIK